MKPYRFNRLLQKMKTDKRALDEIHSEYYPILVMYVNRRFGKLVPAEDIAQEVFLSVLETKPTDYVDTPTAWLCKIAYFTAIDYMTRFEEELPLPPDEPAPFHFDDLLINEDVKRCLSLLDEKTQEIIYLRYWEGYKFKDIAKMVNLSAINVRVKACRAYSIIKKFF